MVVDEEMLRWGNLASQRVRIADVRKILHDESRDALYLELSEEAAKVVCGGGGVNVLRLPRGFSRTEFMDHLRAAHPSIPIETISSLIRHAV